MISCFETVTQHISGQPFCNLSMEALEMMVTYAKHLVVCKPAKSGKGRLYNFLRPCFNPSDLSLLSILWASLAGPAAGCLAGWLVWPSGWLAGRSGYRLAKAAQSDSWPCLASWFGCPAGQLAGCGAVLFHLPDGQPGWLAVPAGRQFLFR